ncbi:hypothetical protein PTR64_03050 [Serratia nevei]|uniref:hypothetical protein n=1 Tax=Serratia nevei TaxID=2703794 RepID=UPI00313C9AD9
MIFVVDGKLIIIINSRVRFMSLISKEEALLELEPYFPLLQKVVRAAWNSWVTGPIAPRMQHKRVRANLVWNDYFFEMIKELSTGEYEGIKFAKIPYNQGFAINDRFFLKFKKADSNFLSSNLQTQSAMKYHDPEIDMFGGEVRLELLYVLDVNGINIDKIAIVQRKDKFVAWAIDLEAENIAEIPQIFEPSPTEITKAVAKKVIKRRKDTKENVVNKDGTNS